MMGYEPVTYCNSCGEPFDVYREPSNRRCESCIDKLIADYGRAELGVDGNAGFALLGPDIQEGEAEFVTVENNDPWQTKARSEAEGRAASKAFRNLQKRLDRKFSYYIGPSHPRHT